jgi:hypothetical protein
LLGGGVWEEVAGELFAETGQRVCFD